MFVGGKHSLTHGITACVEAMSMWEQRTFGLLGAGLDP